MLHLKIEIYLCSAGGSDVLADSITEILQPEDVEKLETALQSEHAKEILGDVLG